MDAENRVVVLIDMDCFYCQVEEKLNPDLKGKPIAVVQYNPWKGGGIIAVNYVARAMGVTRHMRGDEAKEKCPEIHLPSVPCDRGKANISKYREAGKEVARVLQKFTTLLERASIDEAYLDITAPVLERLKTMNAESIVTDWIPNTFALGYESIKQFMADVQNGYSDSIEFDYEHARQLLVGAVIVSEIRAAVFNETGYTCSAGIAHNKILAKLVCGMNKPNKQTVLPKHSVNILYKTLPVKKVKHLGGKFGDNVCDVLKISKMVELQQFTEKELQTKFDEKNGLWLYNIARGVDLEPVKARFNPKSIGCCKNFKGKNALTNLDSLKKWLKDLGDEIEDRLEKDALESNRIPKQMVVSFSAEMADGRDTSSSRSYNFNVDDELCGELFSNKAYQLIMENIEHSMQKDGEPNRKLQTPIKFLGISVGKFEDYTESKKTNRIVDYFTAGCSKEKTIIVSDKDNIKQYPKDTGKDTKKIDKEFIFKKFFQVAEKPTKSAENSCNKGSEGATVENKSPTNSTTDMVSSLDKQESFFAKFLNGNKNERNVTNDGLRSTTPVCQVVECGDNSNDTDYSGSTINMEINKSIALFDDDPIDNDRVSSMRTLLNQSTIIEQNIAEESGCADLNTERESNEEVCINKDISKTMSPGVVEMFHCSECGKNIPVDSVVTHSDYHLALKLREEERQRVRDETKQKIAAKSSKTVAKKVETVEQPKSDHSSITSFFVKLDETIATESCLVCGKKIQSQKLAEHLDFHEAQKLSRELNKKPISIKIETSNTKRKRKSLSPVKKSKVPCKSIETFFR